MTLNRTLWAVLLGGVASIALSAEANAQIASPSQTTPSIGASQPAGGSQEFTGLEDIVVTARKREERLQDVPVAVTAVTGESLEAAHVTNITGLGSIAPNVNISNFANFSFNVAAVIRGIGTIDFEPSSDPAVALFVDGVYQSSTNGSAIDFFDLDGVQVLRGPQGTLFGRNATAGAILVNTRRPTGEFGFRSQFTAGNFGQLEARAALEAPIIRDVLAAKVSFLSAQDDGYYRNFDGRRLGSKDVIAVRPSLLYTPNEALTIYLTGQYIDDRTQSIPGINGGTLYEAGSLGADSGDYRTTSNGPSRYDGDDKSVTLNADLDVGSGTVTLIGNYREYGYFNLYDVDAQSLTILDVPRNEDHEQYSGELRFASDFDGPFNFVTGVLGLHQAYDLAYTIVSDGSFFTGGPFGSGPGTTQLAVQSQQQADSVSLYFQGTYDFGDRLSVDLGGNYSRETKDFLFFNGFAPPGTPPTPASDTWDNFGPKVGVNFKVTEAALLYANYSRGFRSGGFNGRASFLANIGPYDVETVDAFEVGLKSDLFDRRVRLNVAAFDNEFDGLQRPLNNPAFPVESVTTNAANARIRGFEVEFLYQPIEALTFGANASYLDAEYTSYFSDVGGTGADLSALRLANAPEFQSHLFIDLRGRLGVGWIGNFHAEYDRTSSTFTDTANSPVGLREATDIVNLSASIGPEDERFKFGFFVRNLTEEVYVVSSQVSFPYVNEFTINAPRTFGAEISFEY